jgi:tetratricopeptide (TPR) repeat protein
MVTRRTSKSSGKSPATRAAGKKSKTVAAPAAKSRKPVCIATTGNCQSNFLSSVLTSVPGVHVEYFGKQTRFHPFEGRTAPANAPEALVETLARWKSEGNTVILCEQTWPIVDPISEAEIGGSVDHIVRFPNVEAYALWPDRRYSEEQLKRIKPDRALRLDIANVKAAEAKADIEVRDLYDDETFRRILPFDSERHPTTRIFAKIYARIFASPALAWLDFDAADLIARVEASRGLNTGFHHPIATSIIDALDLQWGRTEIYRRWSEASDLLDQRSTDAAIAAIDEMFTLGDSDPFFARMIAPFAYNRYASLMWTKGDHDRAIWAREQCMTLDPYNIVWPQTTARFFLTLDQPHRALETVAASRQFIPPNARLEEIAGDAYMMLGDVDAAKASYESALIATPNHLSSIRRLIAIEADRASTALDRITGMLNSTKYARGKLYDERHEFEGILKEFDKFRRDMANGGPALRAEA